jgi:hypothetical protein
VTKLKWTIRDECRLEDFAARLNHFVELVEALLPLHRLQSIEMLRLTGSPLPRPNIYAGHGYGSETLHARYRARKTHPERDTNTTVITIGELPNIIHAAHPR